MKKIISILTLVLLVTTGCSQGTSPENLGKVQGITPIETTVVEANDGEYANEYNAEDYSIENPFVAIDAYGANPLSAYVVFPIDEAATYSYTVVGKDDNTNYTQTSSVEQSDNMIIPIIGLYQDYNNTVEITVDYTKGDYEQFAINLQTEKLDEGVMLNVDVDTSASDEDTVASAYEGGFQFISSGDAYDSNGDIRVNYSNNKGGLAQPVHYNSNGTFLTYKNGEVTSTDLTGRTLTEYTAPDGLHPHHDAISASNGKVYALMTPNNTYEEFEETGIYNEGIIAVYNEGEGDEPILTVDLSPDFVGNKVNNAPTNQEKGTDLLHLNSISYDEPTNTILVSSQSENMIIGLDADDLTVQWTTADEAVGDAYEDLKLEWKEGHVHSNGQHNIQANDDPKYDDGDDSTIEMSLFSNYYCVDAEGNSVYATLSPDLTQEGCTDQSQSDVLIYRVDTKNKTVETLDQFGFDGYVSGTMSGWTQSLDYKYSFLTYANQGRMLILDENNEVIGEVTQTEEQIEGAGIFMGSYRMPIFSSEMLNNIADTSLENTNY